MKSMLCLAVSLFLPAAARAQGGAPAASQPAAPAASKAASTSGLETDQEKTLYALGAAVGKNVLGDLGLTAHELNFVVMGLKDQVRGGPLKIDPNVYGPKVNELATKRRQAKADAERDKGKAFLARMAKEKGAQKFPSGLIYIPIKAGDGPSPKATDMVRVHYHGTFTDGKVFDSSVEKGRPAEFPLNGVIPCWTEGVQKMKVGGKAKLICPSSIAYGDQGRPGIPGGATLVFEVQLLAIVNK